MPSRAVPRRAVPCRAVPSHALPRQTSPRLAGPRRTAPCQSAPSRTLPCRTKPCLAAPDPAVPSRALPRQTLPYQAVPGRAQPCPAAPRPAQPRLASPSHASPCLAPPGLAVPRRAWPCRAGPCRASPHRALPGLAKPCQAEPCHATPSQAEPCRATPGPALPCRAKLSHRSRVQLRNSFWFWLRYNFPRNQVGSSERPAFFGPVISQPDLLQPFDGQFPHHIFLNNGFVDPQPHFQGPFIKSRPIPHDPAFRRRNRHGSTVDFKIFQRYFTVVQIQRKQIVQYQHGGRNDILQRFSLPFYFMRTASLTQHPGNRRAGNADLTGFRKPVQAALTDDPWIVNLAGIRAPSFAGKRLLGRAINQHRSRSAAPKFNDDHFFCLSWG